MQEQKKTRKKEEPKILFSAGKTFSIEETEKGNELEGIEAQGVYSKYKVKHGQAGDRHEKSATEKLCNRILQETIAEYIFMQELGLIK